MNSQAISLEDMMGFFTIAEFASITPRRRNSAQAMSTDLSDNEASDNFDRFLKKISNTLRVRGN